MSEYEKVKRRLRRKYRKLLAECEQAITDAQSWADNRPEEKPLDAEWFVVQAAGLRKCLAALERDEFIDPAWLQSK